MATPVKFGTEFLVNTTVNGDAFSPAIAGLTNGRFVATWSDSSGNAPDTGSLATRAQIFNADGSKFGAEFVVNTTSNDAQDLPQITALSNGRFAVTFQDFSQLTTGDPASADVRVQVFSANGSKVGPEFVAPATAIGVQSEPVIAGLNNGRYVVAWTDSSHTGGDTSSDAIRSQVFNADGTRFGIERLVNTTTLGQQLDPTVTALAGGDYVVAWTSLGSDADGQSLRSINAQLFQANGTAVGGEYVGNTVAGFNVGQSEPAITGLNNGSYVLTWTNISGFDTNITGQMFNANGTTSGAVFAVNATTANGQADATITALKGGGFVVAWVDYGPFDGTRFNPEIRAQAYRANGTLSGTEFLVNTVTTGVQRAPAITSLADGRFVVSWEDQSGSLGAAGFAVHAQIFDPRTAAVNLIGTKLADDLIGTRFGDTIAGRAGNDTLAGGAGNDVITGGTGVDRMAGGGGADVFVFATAAEAGTLALHDTISDFTHLSDRLDLSAIQAGQAFIGAAGFSNLAGQVRYDVASGLLTGDLNGDGVADYAIELTNHAAITGADLIL